MVTIPSFTLAIVLSTLICMEDPPLYEVDLLPLLGYLDKLEQINTQYIAELECLYRNYPSWPYLATTLEESRHINQWIKLVQEARDSQRGSPDSRRKALRQLKDLVGPRYYYESHVPAAIPTWRLYRH